jgi:xanthine dehydrogenase YagT iron-sulfur-binding subunit
MGKECHDNGGGRGVTRRGFLGTAGAGAVGIALAGSGTEAQAGAAEGAPQVRVRVNGREHRLAVEPRWTLAYVLRDQLGLTGTKAGCERGECGACTVLMNGVPRYACMTLALEAEGAEITTIEGLMKGEQLGPVQQAFLEEDAMQCGYCTPGQVMAVEGLLRANPRPSAEEIREGVSGNLCRCGSYAEIFKAAERAARRRRGES